MDCSPHLRFRWVQWLSVAFIVVTSNFWTVEVDLSFGWKRETNSDNRKLHLKSWITLIWQASILCTLVISRRENSTNTLKRSLHCRQNVWKLNRTKRWMAVFPCQFGGFYFVYLVFTFKFSIKSFEFKTKFRFKTNKRVNIDTEQAVLDKALARCWSFKMFELTANCRHRSAYLKAILSERNCTNLKWTNLARFDASPADLDHQLKSAAVRNDRNRQMHGWNAFSSQNSLRVNQLRPGA